MNLSDTDQAPYSAPAPQTATVSDEAVQVAITELSKNIPAVIWMASGMANSDAAMRKALTAAYPHLALTAAPCSAEVKDILATLDECWEYFDNKADVEDDTDGPIANAELHLLTQVKEAHKALSAILSQIVTKPVDVAAVRDEGFRQGLLVAANSCNRWADDLAGLVDSLEHHLRSKARAIRSLFPAEPVDQWQDIATAPKHGTKIDLWCSHVLHGSVRAPDARWHINNWVIGDLEERLNPDWIPTHWMPLPAAPTSKGGA